jgi:hypothetical protein
MKINSKPSVLTASVEKTPFLSAFFISWPNSSALTMRTADESWPNQQAEEFWSRLAGCVGTTRPAMERSRQTTLEPQKENSGIYRTL